MCRVEGCLSLFPSPFFLSVINTADRSLLVCWLTNRILWFSLFQYEVPIFSLLSTYVASIKFSLPPFKNIFFFAFIITQSKRVFCICLPFPIHTHAPLLYKNGRHFLFIVSVLFLRLK